MFSGNRLNVRKIIMVMTSDGYCTHFQSRVSIEQTLEWITGLHLELICRFENGFHSLDRCLFLAFRDWGMARKKSERVKKPGGLLLIDSKKEQKLIITQVLKLCPEKKSQNRIWWLALLCLLKFIWYLFGNSAGAFCVRVKVHSNDFSTELTWTQQNSRDLAPLKYYFCISATSTWWSRVRILSLNLFKF